jgi:hypothetical protein
MSSSSLLFVFQSESLFLLSLLLLSSGLLISQSFKLSSMLSLCDPLFFFLEGKGSQPGFLRLFGLSLDLCFVSKSILLLFDES